MRRAAPATLSLLGALPLDVYREIFARTDYATLRDACRVLNTVLGPVALQTLHALRYRRNTEYVAPISVLSDTHMLVARWQAALGAMFDPHARWQVQPLRACALPLGGFLVLVQLHDGRYACTDSTDALALASFDAHANLQRVASLPLGSVCTDRNGGAIRLAHCEAPYMHVDGHRVYILLRSYQTLPASHCMMRFLLDAADKHGFYVCPVPRMPAAHVPRDGPARWTTLQPESCAVSATAPLRLTLYCLGVRPNLAMDQAVMLEMDADLNPCRTLTLSTPTSQSLDAHQSAPWPATGDYAGVCAQFQVDTYGRYVLLSSRVGAQPALLLFEPRDGVLLACVALTCFQCNSELTLLPRAEPHAIVCVGQPYMHCVMHVRLDAAGAADVCCVLCTRRNLLGLTRYDSFMRVKRRVTVLDDGYVLANPHIHDHDLVLEKFAATSASGLII